MSREAAQFLRRKAVLDRYQIGESTLYDWLAADKFPKPLVLVPGGRAHVWRVSDLEKWEQQRAKEEAERREAASRRSRRRAS